jgi:Protein of unknown function (DUF2569)
MINPRTMEGPTQQGVSAEPSTPPQYRGIGGWLLFFIFTLTILAPAAHVYVVYNLWKRYDTTPSSLLFNVIAVDWSMRAILIVLGIYAGIRLWLMKSGAPLVAKAYLVGLFGQQVQILLMQFWIASKVGTPVNIDRVIVGPLRSVIYILIWYSYLNKSKRVAATYPEA